MKIGNKKSALIQAVSKLKKADYSREPELNAIYKRLANGRKQFADIFEKNIKAVMEISSLDLKMQHQTEEIMNISQSVAKATETIFGTSEYKTAGTANNQHEELTSTIIQVSSQTEEVYQKIESGQNELTTIKELSDQTIHISTEMQQDMDELLRVINRMTEVISVIDSISLQTNLLSLNASIEASRAGEAGKGFAVVAGEIRSLAEETQKLTKNMSDFVDCIKTASQKSMDSAKSTIQSLNTMTEKIGTVWKINDENQKHVSKVNESIRSIAAVSEEISSSMNEMENQLKNSTTIMHTVGQELKNATKPVVEIEKILDTTIKQMGSMTTDAFYHLENTEFAQYVSNAITAHQTWLSHLKRMVMEQTILPLQLDSSKCGFGHFYYALTPDIPEILPIWKELGTKHKRFHKYGAEAIYALNNQNYARAEQIYQEAELYSRELILDLQRMLQIASKVS